MNLVWTYKLQKMGEMIDTIQFHLLADKKISDSVFSYAHLNLILSTSHCKTDTVQLCLVNCISNSNLCTCICLMAPPRPSDLFFPWLVSKYTWMDEKCLLAKLLNHLYTYWFAHPSLHSIFISIFITLSS